MPARGPAPISIGHAASRCRVGNSIGVGRDEVQVLRGGDSGPEHYLLPVRRPGRAQAAGLCALPALRQARFGSRTPLPGMRCRAAQELALGPDHGAGAACCRRRLLCRDRGCDDELDPAAGVAAPQAVAGGGAASANADLHRRAHRDLAGTAHSHADTDGNPVSEPDADRLADEHGDGDAYRHPTPGHGHADLVAAHGDGRPRLRRRPAGAGAREAGE